MAMAIHYHHLLQTLHYLLSSPATNASLPAIITCYKCFTTRHHHLLQMLHYLPSSSATNASLPAIITCYKCFTTRHHHLLQMLRYPPSSPATNASLPAIITCYKCYATCHHHLLQMLCYLLSSPATNTMLLSEDTFTHQSLQWNMSTLTFRTHSASPTLCTSLHIDVKLHFLQIALSMPPSISTLKHRRKHTLSYLASESESCHCCMYYHCVASLFYFPFFYSI